MANETWKFDMSDWGIPSLAGSLAGAVALDNLKGGILKGKGVSKFKGDLMMMYGYFPFSIDTVAYDSLARSFTIGYKPQKSIKSSTFPKYQLSSLSDNIILSGTIAQDYRGEYVSIDILRDYARKAEANFLISGSGQVFGKFLISEIKDTWTDFAGLGTPQKVTFSATFQRVEKKSGKTGYGYSTVDKTTTSKKGTSKKGIIDYCPV